MCLEEISQSLTGMVRVTIVSRGQVSPQKACCLTGTKACVQFSEPQKLSGAACNPSTQEVKAGAQKFRVTPGYTLRPAEVHETWQTPNKQVSNKKKIYCLSRGPDPSFLSGLESKSLEAEVSKCAACTHVPVPQAHQLKLRCSGQVESNSYTILTSIPPVLDRTSRLTHTSATDPICPGQRPYLTHFWISCLWHTRVTIMLSTGC